MSMYDVNRMKDEIKNQYLPDNRSSEMRAIHAMRIRNRNIIPDKDAVMLDE